MKMHERQRQVSEAHLKLAESVVQIVQVFDLTAMELQSILNQVAASWLRSAIREERGNSMTPDDTEVRSALCRMELAHLESLNVGDRQAFVKRFNEHGPETQGNYFAEVEKIYCQRINELSYEIVERDRQIEIQKLAIVNLQGQVAALMPQTPVVKWRWWGLLP